MCFSQGHNASSFPYHLTMTGQVVGVWIGDVFSDLLYSPFSVFPFLSPVVKTTYIIDG